MVGASSDLVFVGAIGRPHGVRGEVLVWPDSDNPQRFAPGSLLIGGALDQLDLRIVRSRPNPKGGLIVAFTGVDDRTAAEALRGTDLFIEPASRRPLETGEYWPEDLVGLDVMVGGAKVGTVTRVELDAAQVRIEVELVAGGSADVPFVEALVPVVDLDAGLLEVSELEGLLTDR